MIHKKYWRYLVNLAEVPRLPDVNESVRRGDVVIPLGADPQPVPSIGGLAEHGQRSQGLPWWVSLLGALAGIRAPVRKLSQYNERSVANAVRGESDYGGQVFKPPDRPYAPPKNIDRNAARLHGEYSNYSWSELDSIRKSLQGRYRNLSNEYNALTSRLLKEDTPELRSQWQSARDEIDNIVDSLRVVGHRARSEDLLNNARHNTHVYHGLGLRDFSRFNRGIRRSTGEQNKPPVTSTEINDIMREFGYSRYRNQRGTRGTRGGTDTDYLWYRSNTPDLNLQRIDPSSGLNMTMPSSRFLFRIGNHPASPTAANQNKIEQSRFYDISPGSNFRDVEAIKRHLASRLGVPLQEPRQQTPIPPEQLDLFRDYLQSR